LFFLGDAAGTDTAVSASLWVGTSQGSVLVIVINLAAPGEPRLTQPVMVSPSGKMLTKRINQIKGSLIKFSIPFPLYNREHLPNQRLYALRGFH
jgi:hypothetical protein